MDTLELFPIKRPAVKYHGSKFRLAPWIVPLFPEHNTYCEPYGGGAGILLRKMPSKVEIYNDLDSDVVNYFRTLRDPVTCSQLKELCRLTPFSREEYESCWEHTDDSIERARRFVARAWMGFGNHSHNINNSTNGFRMWGESGNHNYASEWSGIPELFDTICNRLSLVTIEHRPALECLVKFDCPTTLFYVDPPYVRSLRDDITKGYVHEMSDRDHEELGWHLQQVKARICLSGYHGPLYDRLYSSWRREERQAFGNGQKGSAARTEVLWMNY
jgi:DNA adenine methylase